MQREYEEFKIRINQLVAKASKVPEDGWTMQDGTPWPGNSVRDHPGMIQVEELNCMMCHESMIGYTIIFLHSFAIIFANKHLRAMPLYCA